MDLKRKLNIYKLLIVLSCKSVFIYIYTYKDQEQ